MKIIKPKIEVEKFDGIKIMKNIERACRTCYKSEGNIKEDSYKTLLKNCITRGHESVLEHEKITIRMICDIGVYKDLTRHRAGASYSIESTRYCVSGDTKLRFLNGHSKFTISEMYNKKLNSKNGQWKRMKIKQLNENTGKFQYVTVKDLFYNGKRKVYKLKTDLRYELICTEDHEIYTPCGYKKLKDLKINDLIYVNGNDVKVLYQDHDWLYNQYITLNKTIKQIAKEQNVSQSTVKKWKERLNIPKKPEGWANVGKEPWNKGLNEDDPRVKRQIEALRENRYDRWKDMRGEYEKYPNGSAIIKKTPSCYRKYKKDKCEVCGRTEFLEVHHKDGNHENFEESNLFTGCPSCHQGIENKSLNILYSDKIISIEELGEVDVYDLEVNSEYHNYIANGIIVHNCNYGKDKFDNEIKFIEPVFYLDKDPDELVNDFDIQNALRTKYWKECMESIESAYLQASRIEKTTADQLRMFLPHSTAAEVTMTCNIREWKHVLSLRANNHAHPSIQQLLIPLLLLFKKEMPEIFDNVEYNEKFEEMYGAKLAEISFIEE